MGGASVQINRNCSFTHWHFAVLFFQTDHKTAYRPFCLLDGSSGIMLSILAAGSVFFPGLFLLSKQCLKSIPALRWSERDAVIVSARWDSPFLPVFWALHETTRLSTHGRACDFPSHVRTYVITSGRLLRLSPKRTIRNSCLIFCCQAGLIGSGRHGHLSWLHHCFFLWGHHRRPVSPVMLLLVWALLILHVLPGVCSPFLDCCKIRRES